jgi:hypothetical protein
MNPRTAGAAVLVVAALAVATACGDNRAPARTALTPISTAHVPNALDLGTVASEVAIEAAMRRVEAAGESLGAQQMPDEPVARLTVLGDLKRWAIERTVIDGEYPAALDDSLIWAVQAQGRWTGFNAAAGSAARFALVGVDAHTGEALAGFVSSDPFMAPSRLRSQQTFTCVTFDAAESRVALGPRQAIDAVRASYPQGAASKPGSEWDFERADAATVRCVDTVAGTDSFKFRWIVTVPSKMALHDCSTPSTRQVDLKKRCWSPLATHLVDGITGEVMGRNELELTGPLLTDQDFDQVKRFAASTNWWEAWARLSAYNDSIIPGGILETLMKP